MTSCNQSHPRDFYNIPYTNKDLGLLLKWNVTENVSDDNEFTWVIDEGPLAIIVENQHHAT